MLTRRFTITACVCAVILGALVSLISAAINAMPDDEPLSTHAASRPLHIPSVREYPPDSRKDFKAQTLPTQQPSATPSINPVKPPAVTPTVHKPKAPQQ